MAHHLFSKDEDSTVLAYRGKKPAHEIGAMLGRSADAVRRRWRKLGLTATLPPTAAEKRARPPREPKPAKPLVQPSASTADLVAQYLASRPITACPPGMAAGIAPLELALGFTAQPAPTLTYRQRGHQLIAAAKARRAA